LAGSAPESSAQASGLAESLPRRLCHLVRAIAGRVGRSTPFFPSARALPCWGNPLPQAIRRLQWSKKALDAHHDGEKAVADLAGQPPLNVLNGVF